MAAFYVANPDHPLPRSITVSHYPPTPDDVRAVAARFADGHTYGANEGIVQTDFYLPNTSVSVQLTSRYDGIDRSHW